MSNTETSFICPNCGSYDFGRYCSHCSSPLQPTSAQIPTLLSLSLISKGYNKLAVLSTESDLVRISSPTWFPSLIVNDLSDSFVSFGFSDVELLAFDRTNIRQIELLAILTINPSTQNKIPDLAETLVSKINVHKDILRKQYKIKRLEIIFYLIFPEGILRDTVDSGRTLFPKRFTLKFNINVSFIGISANTREFYPRSMFAVDLEKQLTLQSIFAQFHLDDTLREQQRQQHGSFWRSLLHFTVERPTEEFRKFFWIFLSIIRNPMYYAAEIDRGRLTLKTALSYLLLLVIIDTAIDKTVGLNEIAPLAELLPFGGELIVFLFFVVLLGVVCWHCEFWEGKEHLKKLSSLKLYSR